MVDVERYNLGIQTLKQGTKITPSLMQITHENYLSDFVIVAQFTSKQRERSNADRFRQEVHMRTVTTIAGVT